MVVVVVVTLVIVVVVMIVAVTVSTFKKHALKSMVIWFLTNMTCSLFLLKFLTKISHTFMLDLFAALDCIF